MTNSANGSAAYGIADPPGPRIRAARHKARLSQEALARRADCSLAYVRMAEAAHEARDGDVFRRIIAVVEELEREA